MKLLDAINTLTAEYNRLAAKKPLLKPLKRYNCVKRALNSGFFLLDGRSVGFSFNADAAEASLQAFSSLIECGHVKACGTPAEELVEAFNVSFASIYCYRSGQNKSYPFTEAVMEHIGEPLTDFEPISIDLPLEVLE